MLSRYLKGRFDLILRPVIKIFPDHGFIPNLLTLAGLFMSILVGIFFATGYLRLGGVFLILAGLFDILDGVYARVFNLASSFGAFIDSTSDRYADMIIISGLGILYASQSKIGYLVLTLLTMAGFVMVSYTKARAEAIISACEVGIMERPERIIVLIIGAFTLRIDICLWILAILTHVTALQRIWYTYQKIQVDGMGLKEVI